MRTKRNRTVRHRFDRENGIVVATVVLCFMLTLALCYFFAGEGLLTSAFSKETGKTFYAVCQGGYDNITLARSAADLIKLRGGAGFVLLSEKSEIVLAVYPDYSQAKSVLDKLKDKSSYIKEIKAEDINLSWANEEETEAAETALTYFDLAFDTLYAQSNNLADGNATIDDIKNRIKVLYIQIDDLKSVFYSKIADSERSEITEIKLALVTCLALLDNVNTEGTTASVLSSLRYQTVQLVLCYQALCNNK